MQFAHAFNATIEGNLILAWLVLIAAFWVLAKCADIFVDSSVALANAFRVPKLVIGIVLVSLATTAPELSVSLVSALRGRPEMALGNAVGSVICNTGLALALCGLISAHAVHVIPHVLKTAGGFLVAVSLLCFLFVAADRTLGRVEGLALVTLFAGYLVFIFRQHKRGVYHGDIDLNATEAQLHMSRVKLWTLFAGGLLGIIAASNFVVTSATTIARAFGVPEAVIALTLVALGTSIPEVATCVTAARRGEGELAVGNILGANIMNICWVAGASAVANRLVLPSHREVFFMFPAMFAVVLTALVLLRTDYRLTRRQGVILLGLYAAYLVAFFAFFPLGR